MELYKEKLSIHKWAEGDRPREKLMQHGRRTLSDAELIAILIGSGSAEESAVALSQRILSDCENNLNNLGSKSVEELCEYKGIGEAKAIAVIAALELARRKQETKPEKRPKIQFSADVNRCLRSVYADLDHEEFWILLLNQANRVMAKKQISRGGRAGTVVDAKIVFEAALRHKASGIVLSHNHPSGHLAPSPQDRDLTKAMVKAGKLLNIRVLDHVIFGQDSYYSFCDEGLM